jgi:aryl sulfotransferase
MPNSFSWRDVLTEDDLKLYHAAVARELTPDCAEWLENGRLA